MKTISTLFFTILFAGYLQATTITAVVNNGDWEANATWSLNRQPQSNDTIYIPTGITVQLNQHIILNNISVFVGGTLRFVGGKLTLNNLSTILIQTGGRISGTSNSEQIRLGGIFKYKGEEGVILGPALANAVSGEGFLPLTLPVRFISFTVKRIAGKNDLTWVTSDEVNNSHFDVERSLDGQTWNSIAVVFATGNSGTSNRYTYTDQFGGPDKLYYRLKQIDKDGKYAYSAIKTVNGQEQMASAKIYTSGRNTIAIEFNDQVKGKVSVRIFNISGQAVSEQQINATINRIEIYVPNVISGIYAVQVRTGENKTEVKKVIL